MTDVEQRFVTAAREADTAAPGLIQEDDGTVWLVKPDGVRTLLEGGGGGLPSQWTVDAHGNLIIDSDGNTEDFSPNIVLRFASGDPNVKLIGSPDSNDVFTITDSDHPNGFNFGIDAFGYISGGGALFDTSALLEPNTTPLTLGIESLTTRDAISVYDGTATAPLRLNHDGYLVLHARSAPPDDDLDAGDVALYFDATNGAAKLMFKAKQADGSVKTGSVNVQT